MKATKFLILLFLILISTTSSFSEKIDAPIEVKVNVLVLDKEQNFIDDIKKEDIGIFEDGIEQKITYFAKKEPVLNTALLFDNSGSVRNKLDEIMKCGKIFVANLREKDQAFVVRFTDSDRIEVIQDWTENKSELTEAIDNLYVESGQTAVLDAVFLAAEKLQERQKSGNATRQAIILFSDAEDRDSFFQLNAVLKKLKETDLQIFLLSYALSAPEKSKAAIRLSHILALETGGTVYLLPRKTKGNELIDSLKAIVFELRSQFIIGYTSTNQKRDGLARKLTLNISKNEKGEERFGYIREGFTVPKK